MSLMFMVGTETRVFSRCKAWLLFTLEDTSCLAGKARRLAFRWTGIAQLSAGSFSPGSNVCCLGVSRSPCTPHGFFCGSGSACRFVCRQLLKGLLYTSHWLDFSRCLVDPKPSRSCFCLIVVRLIASIFGQQIIQYGGHIGPYRTVLLSDAVD